MPLDIVNKQRYVPAPLETIENRYDDAPAPAPAPGSVAPSVQSVAPGYGDYSSGGELV